MRISPRLLALVPVAVAINLVVGGVVRELALPVFLDTLGTMLVAVLLGVGAGVFTGTLSQLFSGLLSGYQYLPFVVIQWLIALLAAVAARRRGFAGPGRSVAWGAACGLVSGAASAVISYLLFRGGTGGGVAAINTLLVSLGVDLRTAVTIGSVTTDVLDKTVSFLTVGILLRRMPLRILGRFSAAARAIGR